MASFRYDMATAQTIGRRDCQEDAVVGSFPLGCDLGFAVLADGMGGHAAGDVAARIVVTEVFSELLFRAPDLALPEADLPTILQDSANAANACIAAHTQSDPTTRGMGATLVAPVFLRNGLWWISIGDSPLFLYRGMELRQLNEDHSLAPQIDFMMANGLIDRSVGQTHPDRNVLTSALFGEPAPRIDCPDQPLPLQDGDIVVVASDGLQFLEDAAIAKVLATYFSQPSAIIAGALLKAVDEFGHAEQDNASFAVIRVLADARARMAVASEKTDMDDIPAISRSA